MCGDIFKRAERSLKFTWKNTGDTPVMSSPFEGIRMENLDERKACLIMVLCILEGF